MPLTVRTPGGVDVARLEGKLDTGADVCAVPERLVAELDLPPVRTVRAAGFRGELDEVTAYRMDLELDRLTFPRIETLATRRAYAIIGRNALCSLVPRSGRGRSGEAASALGARTTPLIRGLQSALPTANERGVPR